MLVLSRQRDESIMVGDEIVFTIVDIRGDKVRIGIEAPPHIPVHREEVYRNIKREGAIKALPDGDPLFIKYVDRADPPAEFVAQFHLGNESYQICAVWWTLYKERRRTVSRDEVIDRMRTFTP